MAAGGGTALLATIVVHEHTRERRMRASRKVYLLRFPAGATATDAAATLRSLAGLSDEHELIVEVGAGPDGIRHLIQIPEAAIGSVVGHFEASLPGARIDEATGPSGGRAGLAVRFWPPTLALLRSDDVVASSRALLSGLGALRPGEQVRLSWALRPGTSAPLASTDVSTKNSEERIRDRALAQRVQEPGFRITGLLVVHAEPDRARELSEHVQGVIRGRRRVGAGMLVRSGKASATALPSTFERRGWLSAEEILPLLAWPLGDDLIAGVEAGVSRRLLVPSGVPSSGRALFVGRDGRGERPVALSAEAARHHSLYVGPSGVGKSVALARGALSDIEHGYGGVLIDPKADLAADVLDRVRPEDADRIVVLDPGAGSPVPGLDLFSSGDPDLRADVILGALGAIFRDHWGPRTESYLRLGLATLSAQPKPVLSDWMRLFGDPGFRRQAVARLTDPMLTLEWARFEALTAAEQVQHVQAPASRLVSLLSRPALRHVLAQDAPKLDIPRLLTERKWLIVSLSPGSLGEPATRLLGAIIVYSVWSAIEQRSALPPAQRHPVFLVVDELQTIASLPFGLEYLLERARGLGCGVSVATQGLGRLPESMRASLLTNVATLVAFRQGHQEAERIARELPGITAADLQGLRPFEVAARVAGGRGSAVSVMTGVTEAPAPVTGQADRIRRLSAERYGGLASDLDGSSSTPDGDLSDEITQIGRAS
ncbi:hypothetical protein LRS13_12555 [Svornostia abyssi]|uniref:Type IV secretion system coupling protein TraD DNA-binding domain-containing protein n=1 Tax=Svornostia abyssi TaxID=2898438 RepID=A0ABY5PAT7_9ACTN|nr:hypothetical protein LRS13_12555 [Parviterribacteraceae bacterium J379]